MATALAGGAGAFLFLSWLRTEHFLPWLSWHSEVLVFMAVLAIAWACVAATPRTPALPALVLPFAALPFIALALIVVVQWIAGMVPFHADILVLWFYVFLCIVCMSVGFAVAMPTVPPGASRSIEFLAWTLLLGALASTVIALAQVFGIWENSGWIVRMLETRRPGGNLAQPNHLATLQVMGVASLVFLRRSTIRLGTLASGMVMFLLSAGLAITESRTGALSLLALLGWWLVKRQAIGDRTSIWVGASWGIGFLAMFLAWPRLLNASDLWYQAAGRISEGSGRFEVWSQLLQAVFMRPWAGWGFHQVVAAHNAVVDRYAVSEPYSYSHNLVLDFLVWLGVPLTLLFVGAGVTYVWRRTRAASQMLPWYGLAVALPLAVHSMFEYPFAYAYFLAPVMFLIGAVEASTGAKPLARVGLKSAVTVLGAVTVVMAWSVVEYFSIEEDFRVARFQSLRIGAVPSEHERPRVILFDQLGLLLDDTRITPKPGMSPEAMQVVRNAALYYPWSATQYRYALALALNGNPAEATRQLRVMRAMWGDKLYKGVKQRLGELAATEYPQLRQMNLP